MKNNFLMILLGLVLNSCSAQKGEKVLIKGEEVFIFDSGSEFFHESIKKRLVDLDTTLTPKHLLAYTWYVQKKAPFNPKEMDEKAEEMYQLNEKGKYQKALEKGREIRAVSPNNIAAFKEMGFAFNRLGQDDSVQIYFTFMVKAIEGARLSGDGGQASPYVLNNWFELRSLIEASSGLYASKKAVFKDSKGRIIGFAMVESPKMGYFACIDHWSKYLKKGELIEIPEIEENMDKDLEKEMKEILKESEE